MANDKINEAVESAGTVVPGIAAVNAAAERLAGLGKIEYDLARKDEAKRLGLRVDTLDSEVDKRRPEEADNGTEGTTLFADLEPWPDPVDGSELLDTLAVAFARHMVLPDGAATALSLWVLHAHAHDAAHISPILAIRSPVKRCGKTTCLSIVQALSPRPLPTSNITAAALFRAVEKWAPTLLIDEADTFLRNNDELRGVLNSGHNRASAFVVRTVGDNHDAAHFRTWAPKSIALIGGLPDTLQDRSIMVRLRRKKPNEVVERLRLDRVGELTALARRAARWAADNIDALRDADPDIPKELHDRAADNWRALIAIADNAGGNWPELARKVARLFSSDGDGSEDAAGVLMLADIRAIFEDRGVDRITSADLVEALHVMEDRPWPEWRQGKPITTRQVARLLNPFDISPRVIRTGTGTPRGYVLDAFFDAFASYLPHRSATVQQVNDTNGYSEISSATLKERVADKNLLKPLENNECCTVADENPQNAGLAKNTAENEGWSTKI
jgi:putative DNA primase/helicase